MVAEDTAVDEWDAGEGVGLVHCSMGARSSIIGQSMFCMHSQSLYLLA